MEISPKTFREVEFREKRHGYHPEDVDQFLEQMATGIESLQENMRQAVERAQRAEQAASEAGGNDETIRKTLVLAQRTADAAVAESRDQASRILASAEQQAHAMVADAEERARRLHGEALADLHSEMARLEATRAQSQQEVDVLSRWASEHRSRLATTLQEALTTIDRIGVMSPPPSSTPIDVPSNPPRRPAGGAAVAPVPPPAEPDDRPAAGPTRPPESAPPPPGGLTARPTQASFPAAPSPAVGSPPGPGPGPGAPQSPSARPPEPVRSAQAGPAPGPPVGGADQPTQAIPTVEARRPIRPDEAGPTGEDMLSDPDDESLDSYFEDSNLGDDRRFGGRLRRRR